MWDFAGERGPISVLWRAARDLDPGVVDESDLPGAREGDLERLCHAAGLARVESGELTVSAHHEGFDQWWEPYTLGVGPAGAYVKGLDEEHRVRCASTAGPLCPRRLRHHRPRVGGTGPRLKRAGGRPGVTHEPAGRHTEASSSGPRADTPRRPPTVGPRLTP